MSKNITPGKARHLSPPVDPTDALANNLLHQMQKRIQERGVEKMVDAQIDKADNGDTKAFVAIKDLMMAMRGAPAKESQMILIPQRDTISIERRADAVRLLSRGPLHTEDLASALGMSTAAASVLLTHRWFVSQDDGWHATPDGHADVLQP